MKIDKVYQNLHYVSVTLAEHLKKGEDNNYIINGEALGVIVKKLTEAEQILEALQPNKRINPTPDQGASETQNQTE